jgi:hypothetical protein
MKYKYAQIESHADGITTDQYIIATFCVVEKSGLFASNFRGQRPINNGASEFSLPFHTFLQREYIGPSERHQAITRLNAMKISVEALLLYFQRREALISMDNKLITSIAYQGLDDGDSSFFATKVQLPRAETQHSVSPCPTSLWVSYHLDLIDDAYVISVYSR